MLDRLRHLLRVPERRALRTARLIAPESGVRARWTPRDYAALSRAGYTKNTKNAKGASHGPAQTDRFAVLPPATRRLQLRWECLLRVRCGHSVMPASCPFCPRRRHWKAGRIEYSDS
jgi:hypothetical protein